MTDPTAPPKPSLASQIAPDLGGALAFLGPWGALAGLALKFGVPFVDHLISNSKNNVAPSQEEWGKLKAKIDTGFDEL